MTEKQRFYFVTRGDEKAILDAKEGRIALFLDSSSANFMVGVECELNESPSRAEGYGWEKPSGGGWKQYVPSVEVPND